MNIIMILAHKNSEQLKRFIEKLKKLNCLIFIHLDKKASINEFSYIKNINRVFLFSKYSVFLDDRSLIDSVFFLVKKAIGYCEEKNITINRFALFSGQDYPIKKLDDIKNYFDKKCSYIDMNEMSSTDWIIKKIRYNKLYYFARHLNIKYKNNFVLHSFSIVLYKISRLILKKHTLYDCLKNYKIYGGSAWLSLSYEHMNYCLLQYTKKTPLSKLLLSSYTPEEIYFQTILANSHFLKEIIDCNYNFMFSNFTPPGLPITGHPYILEKKDYENLVASKYFFARKFDINQDEEIFNQLDHLFYS